MAFQSGTIDPNSTAPADDIYKLINDLAVLRTVIGGNTDPQVPSSWEPIHASSTLVTSGTAPSYVATTTFSLTAYALGVRLRLQFHATLGSGTPTLNVNGLGAKNLRQYNSAGAKVAATIVASQLTEVVYDGTDFVLLAALPPVSGVTSVAGKTGAVTLTTDDVAEGANLYFTNARAQAAVTSGSSNIEVFSTPGTTSWTVPAGVTRCKVTVVAGGGGGGGGGQSGTTQYAGGGGGGGGAVVGYITIPSGTSNVGFTIGSGGNGGATNGGTGASGGASSFGPVNGITLSATGGAGGTAITPVGNTSSSIPVSGGSGSATGYVGSNFAVGGGGFGFPVTHGNPGFGGSSGFHIGIGGKGGIGTVGNPGTFGGGGGGSDTGGTKPGAAGGAGVIIIEY